MTVSDIVVIAIVAVIVVLALRYIIKTKKSGAKCIGCPSGGCCDQKSCCGCQTEDKE